jgi:hypothetical protein
MFVHSVVVPGEEGPSLGTPAVIDADYVRKLGVVGGNPVYLFPARVQFVTPASRRRLRQLSVKGRRYRRKFERADRKRGVVRVFAQSFGFISALTYHELVSGGSLFGEGKTEPTRGLEPRTPSLQVKCSAS